MVVDEAYFVVTACGLVALYCMGVVVTTHLAHALNKIGTVHFCETEVVILSVMWPLLSCVLLALWLTGQAVPHGRDL